MDENSASFNINDLRRVEIEIMDIVHKICIDYNLKYSLAYGTLLGAIRHQGFIPWDDDIDIMMPRNDYEKLLVIWDNVAPKDYILQTYKNSDDYTNNFAKIRKNHTTFLQIEEEKSKKYHKGIFVDIFPVDCVAQNKISRKIQYCAFAINLLYSRGFKSGSKGLINIVESILLSTNKKNYCKRKLKAEKFMIKWNKKAGKEHVIACTIKDCRRYYPADMFDELELHMFDQRYYYVTKKFHEFLSKRYGDYMVLPPEDERTWKHHPISVSFEYNYEELKR